MNFNKRPFGRHLLGDSCPPISLLRWFPMIHGHVESSQGRIHGKGLNCGHRFRLLNGNIRNDINVKVYLIFRPMHPKIGFLPSGLACWVWWLSRFPFTRKNQNSKYPQFHSTPLEGNLIHPDRGTPPKQKKVTRGCSQSPVPGLHLETDRPRPPPAPGLASGALESAPPGAHEARALGLAGLAG